MDAQIRKLGLVLDDPDLATKLVDAGLDTPRKIKAATDHDIEAIKDIGPATRQSLRDKLGQARGQRPDDL